MSTPRTRIMCWKNCGKVKAFRPTLDLAQGVAEDVKNWCIACWNAEHPNNHYIRSAFHEHRTRAEDEEEEEDDAMEVDATDDTLATQIGTIAANSAITMSALTATTTTNFGLLWTAQETTLDLAIAMARTHGVGHQAAGVYRRLVASRCAELERDDNMIMLSIVGMKGLLLERGL